MTEYKYNLYIYFNDGGRRLSPQQVTDSCLTLNHKGGPRLNQYKENFEFTALVKQCWGSRDEHSRKVRDYLRLKYSAIGGGEPS